MNPERHKPIMPIRNSLIKWCFTIAVLITLCCPKALGETSSETRSQNFNLEIKALTASGWVDLGLSNAQITKAHAYLNGHKQWGVAVDFTPIALTKFRYLTASMIGYQFGAFVNNQPAYGVSYHRGFSLSQPCIPAIPGLFTKEQASDLATKLSITGLQPTRQNLKYTYSIPLSQKLSQEDIQFGQEQLQALLFQRPEMKLFVKPNDNVWNWTVNQLAGQNTKRKIRWNSEPPHDVTIDSSITISDKEFSTFRLRQMSRFGVPIDGEMLWSRTVYELINARGAEKVLLDLNIRAKKRLLSRAQYIREVAAFEYNSWKETAAFYKTVWRPHARYWNLTASDIYWQVDIPSSFDGWMNQFTDPNAYPFNLYGTAFDRITN